VQLATIIIWLVKSKINQD